MRDAVQDEIQQAAEEFENELNPLVLKTDHSAHLAKEYKVTDAKIAELANRYLPLTIAGVEDKNGYALVHSARMEVKTLRNAVESKRKDLKADSLAYGRAVDQEAKRITAMLAPIESHLETQEKAVDAEKERIKAEAQRKVDERNQGRLNTLLAVGAEIPLSEVVLMSDEVFLSYLDLATKAFQERERVAAEAAAAEAARVEAEAAEKAKREREEAAAREAERQALAAERARMEAAKAENDRIARELKAQQDSIDAQRRALEQAARDEQARKDAEVKAQAEAERKAKAEQEAKEKAQAAETIQKAAAEAKRLAAEAARPDAEKLVALANAFDQITFPEMSTPAGKLAIEEITKATDKFCKFIENKAAGLTEFHAV